MGENKDESPLIRENVENWCRRISRTVQKLC